VNGVSEALTNICSFGRKIEGGMFTKVKQAFTLRKTSNYNCFSGRKTQQRGGR
jgi:hypothetical protein